VKAQDCGAPGQVERPTVCRGGTKFKKITALTIQARKKRENAGKRGGVFASPDVT